MIRIYIHGGQNPEMMKHERTPTRYLVFLLLLFSLMFLNLVQVIYWILLPF